MGKRIPRIKTEVSESQMAQAIIESWKELFNGTVPTKDQVAMVLAQNALETGHRKSLWNFNIGNITTDGKGSFDFFDDLETNEQIAPGSWKKMNLKYRAYPTLKDGMKDYLKLLSGKKYSNAWEHIINPNAISFSKALKQQGYYTADEAKYTKTMKSLFDRFSKSDSYEKAKSGKDDLSKKYVANQNNIPSKNDALISTIDDYLQQIAASEKSYKKLYKQYLPLNNILIKIQSNDIVNSIEFSRILCSALDEKLLAKTVSFSNNNLVEVECSINGPSNDCFNAVKQLTTALSDTFKTATIKIGGVTILTKCVTDKRSSYKPINSIMAFNQYNKFLLKFI